MLNRKWQSYTITATSQFQRVKELAERYEAEYGGFDTETTGLNIGLDKPFVFACGLLAKNEKLGATFAVDLEKTPEVARAFIQFWHEEIASNLCKYMAHNIKFDLHMLFNIGLPYTCKNVTDTTFFIRHGHDHIPTRFGGVSLKLKEYSTQYISYNASKHEKLLKKALGLIAKNYNIQLMQRLKPCGTPPEKYGAKSYTMSVIEEMFKDCIFELSDLPENIRQQYLDWFTLDLPAWLQRKVHGLVKTDNIQYDKIDRKILIQYVHWDIIYMLEVFDKLLPVVENRQTMNAIQMEEELIYPFFRMEQTGFKIDINYLLQSKEKMRKHIQKLRKNLYDLAGREFKVGQHELIKNILNNDFDLNIESTRDEELSLVYSKLKSSGENERATDFIKLLQELRTLEKWYKVYLIRFLDNLHSTDHLYMQINQVGAVSGRVSSDFQQMPRKGIKDREGNELFDPRKMVIPEGENYSKTFCIDYSQIELRIQAFYTILVGDPDLNMCRAYFPFKCKNKDGISFDFQNPQHLRNWNKEWFYEEDPEKQWIPTDLHGITTKTALDIDETHPDWANLRASVGKVVNFAENYGAQWGRIRIMFPDKTDDEVTKIFNAYGIAYPGVKTYHKYCYDRAQNYCFTSNLFGIRYYNTTGHKLINLLVQGSAASLLKWKIIQIDEYICKNNLKSKMQMQIHDELMFICFAGEEQYFLEIQKIMETWEDSYVPIVAEVSEFTTNWAEKKAVS